MRKVKLFIAMSLDGYIGDENGKVDWLNGQSDEEMPDVYSKFIQDVDTVILGYNTYEQIVNELSPDMWVYENLQSYVITHRKIKNKENITFCDLSPVELVHQLKQRDGKDIWICGGSQIIHQLMKENVIDEYYISVIPVLLGSGIPLFHSGFDTIHLQLIGTKSYNGITDLIYRQRSGD